jgi:trehalose synthase
MGEDRPLGVLATVTVGRLRLERFESVLSPDRYEEVRSAAERASRLLEGRVVWNVNSTARGGGVAKMLISLLAYAQGAGVDTRWLVMPGSAPFFAVTKRIHNNLHSAQGDGGELGDAEREVYEQALEPSIAESPRSSIAATW